MQLTDKYTFGQYKTLTLKAVYQGTPTIDKSLLKNFLYNCVHDTNVPKPDFFELCDLLLTEDEIIVIPQIFDEDKPESLSNVIHLGDLSADIENYFNSFFRKNWYGIVENLEKFNNNKNKQVIGGDPDYIEWCIREVSGFTIDDNTKGQLEALQVYRLLGISVKLTSNDKYLYSPKINKEFYKFKGVR